MTSIIKRLLNVENREIMPYNLKIYDEKSKQINTARHEKTEQLFAYKYIDKNDIVLELGARYGSVSCIINKKLSNKKNQLSVEPDSTVWNALENNIKINNCDIQIFKGIISAKKYDLALNGYATTSVESNNSNIQCCNLQEIQSKYGLHFNTLVADCEGFLEHFFDENPDFCTQLYKVIFEADQPHRCNYEKIQKMLTNNGFIPVEVGFQNVYIKK